MLGLCSYIGVILGEWKRTWKLLFRVECLGILLPAYKSVGPWAYVRIIGLYRDYEVM